MIDINIDYLNEVVNIIHSNGGNASVHIVDIAQREAVKQLSIEIMEQYKSIDLLINNAGIGLARENFQETSWEHWNDLMDVNFWGTLNCTLSFYPYLKQQTEAHIVNVSSAFAMIGMARRAAYSASKFAVRGLTESMIHEARGSNVHVSLVLPGGVATPMVSHAKGHRDLKLKEALSQMHNRISQSSAETAAQTIIKGIKRNRKRIFIGADAKFIDYLVRFSPQFLGGFINRIVLRTEAKAVQKIKETEAGDKENN